MKPLQVITFWIGVLMMAGGLSALVYEFNLQHKRVDNMQLQIIELQQKTDFIDIVEAKETK